MAQTNPQPSLLRKLGRGLYDAVAFTAMASTLPAAVFGYLAWQEAKSSSPDVTAIAVSARELARMSEQALEQRRDELELQRGTLLALGKLLPETERSRLGIERLVHLTERRLADVKEQQAERRREGSRQQQQAQVAGGTARSSPTPTPGPGPAPSASGSPAKEPARQPASKQPVRTPNQIAKQIWKEMTSQ